MPLIGASRFCGRLFISTPALLKQRCPLKGGGGAEVLTVHAAVPKTIEKRR